MSALLRLLKPKKEEKGKPWTPRVYYYVVEAPVTVEVGGNRYECRSVQETSSGLLCVQYDGTAVLLPPQQQLQQQQKLRFQLV